MTPRHGRRRRCALALLALFGCAVHAAVADDYFSPTDDRVRLSLGVMRVSSTTSIRADSSAGVAGTDIAAESQLGLTRSVYEPKFEAVVRADTRQRLSFDYFKLDRSGNAIADNDIVFRNVVFMTGDPLQSALSLRTLGMTYEYSFWHGETLEIAGAVGVHATSLAAEAKVETQTRHIIQLVDQAGPLPTLGIDATWVASKRFYFNGRAQYLTAHVKNIDGSLGIYEFDALYRYRPNVSLAVGYADIHAHLTSTEAAHHGLFDFTTRGPEIFVQVAF
jgi:enamine deaminase RidA (YjgF/YER057c/UK114 family)